MKTEQTFQMQAQSEIVRYWHEQIPIVIQELTKLFDLPSQSWVKFNDSLDVFVVTLGLGQYYDSFKINYKISIKFWDKYRIDDELTNADMKTGYRYIFIRMKELEVSQNRNWRYRSKQKDCLRSIG